MAQALSSKQLICLGLLGCLLSCQQPGALPSATQSTSALLASGSQAVFARSQALRPEPQVQMTLQPDPQHTGLATAHFAISMPRQPVSPDFRTQAIASHAIQFIQLEVEGIGIETALRPEGADAEGLLPNPGGTFTLSVSGIPYGTARLASLRCYGADRSPIPGAAVRGAFHVSDASASAALSYRSTPTAEVLADLMGSPAGNHLAAQLDLQQLQGFVDALTGFAGTAPNYTYTTHPALIAASAIATDLQQNQGNIAALQLTEPSYKITPGQVQVQLAGLISSDTADLVMRDPASALLAAQGNGHRLMLQVVPGTWRLEALATGYTADRSPDVTVSSGQTADAGTIQFSLSQAPQLQSLSSSQGVTGSSLTLTGQHFHPIIAGNLVTFNQDTVAVVQSASATELVVAVPAGLYGSQSVRVTVGGQHSESQPFAITPQLNSLSETARAVGQSLTLSGSGFSPTLSENTVRLGETQATVTAATANSLTIIVPTAPNGNLTVQVGTQTSNGLALNVLPSVSLTQPTNNALLNGQASLLASPVSSNPITGVSFLANGNLIGTATTAPYSLSWDTLSISSGSYTLQARVTDSQNNESLSESVDITINQAPVITAIQPSFNPVPGLGYPVLLNCQATDSDNTLESSAYSWSTDGGEFGSFSSTQGAQVFWSAPLSAGGPYLIRCTVNDGVNPAVSQTLSLPVLQGTGHLDASGGIY